MTRTASLLSFLPVELIPLMLVLGGGLLIIGLRRAAMTLFTLSALMIFLPPVVEAVLNELPEWILIPVMLFALVNMVVFGLTLLVGPRAWNEAKAMMIAKGMIWCLGLPFRLIAGMWRVLFRR
ncbi:MAG: hypothetical protein Q4G66_13280 [bacterium]|nr:hypothetical protein [bacterium]